MIVRFPGPRALLERAKGHLKELEAHASLYRRNRGYALIQNVDPFTRIEYRRIKVTKPVPVEAACVTYDIVNEMRSVLDYAVYESVKLIKQIDDPESTKFPFGDDFGAAENTFERDGKGVPCCIRDFLLDFGPYPTGNKTLWAFNKLRNHKIHRSLAPMIIANTSISIGGNGFIGELTPLNEWDPTKGELTYAKGRDIGKDIEIRAAVEITFAEGTSLARSPLVGTLLEVHSIVSSVVLGLEAETARIIASRP